MEEKMRFGVITAAHRAEVHERPLPPLGDDQVLLRMETCNICTTDYGLWTGARKNQPMPMAGGHENAGVIIKKGKNAGSHLNIGDRVGLVAYENCGQCRECRLGHTLGCTNIEDDWVQSEDGYWGDFGFANYYVADARNVIKFHSDIPFEEIGFLENLSTVMHGIHMLDIKPFETVVVIGAGTMGLLNAMAARAYGAEVLVTEVDEKKIARAKKEGFPVIHPGEAGYQEQIRESFNGRALNSIIVAAGVTPANRQALELAQMDTKILFFAAGYPAPDLPVGSNEIHYKRLRLMGTFGAELSDIQIAADLLDSGRVKVSGLIEAHYPLDDIQKAYEAASTPGAYRVAVHMWKDEEESLCTLR
ncbi:MULTISPECIES: alcohol dehydrogenase catalytic domain-containing protein [Clostridia]|jgi:threonine dehydrogenase-like Zn-dependent dehydrogenase|uniref:zinc-dependent alcohol dehydrogenase n=1 Tax=Clostridia TaxID=186801 RepID=UPI0015FBADAB|nr:MULTISPECIES: alcohol dehydrogenase catalytic domain-containing protein [Clostridia]